MNSTLKTAVVGTTFVALMGLAGTPQGLGFVPEAAAWFRAPIARTAVVVGATTAVVASSTANVYAASEANANAAAAANANAAAANANAAAAAAKSGPPPVGSMTTTLPPGCVAEKLNGVDYQRCGPTYYRAQMQGNVVVFVVSQP